MTQNREFYAATVEEAVAKAAEDLGSSPEDLSYEVVDAGAAGFLGIGARDARIVVQSDAPVVEAETAQPLVSERSEQQSDTTVDTVTETEAADEDEILHPSSAEDRNDTEPVPAELLQEIDTLVSTILDKMGFEARVDVYDAGDVIAVDVVSQETGLFIGQKGETIDALQYLVNVAVFKNREFSKRIVLDSEGYRQRRVEALQGMAHRTARRVIRERRRVELPPMNSAERRIVHVYLKDNPAVITVSEGTGSSRRVTVAPA